MHKLILYHQLLGNDWNQLKKRVSVQYINRKTEALSS
jgi:hypothetical protein